jgi:hypothetical protein
MCGSLPKEDGWLVPLQLISTLVSKEEERHHSSQQWTSITTSEASHLQLVSFFLRKYILSKHSDFKTWSKRWKLPGPLPDDNSWMLLLRNVAQHWCLFFVVVVT